MSWRVTIWARVTAQKVVDAGICLIRKVWRPIAAMGLAASVWVNLVIIPWKKGTPIEFTSASTYVGAICAAFAVREVGKYFGTTEK